MEKKRDAVCWKCGAQVGVIVTVEGRRILKRHLGQAFYSRFHNIKKRRVCSMSGMLDTEAPRGDNQKGEVK